MPIQSIFTSMPVESLMKTESQPKLNSSESQQNFGEFLKNAINDVNNNQVQSDVLTQKLVLGEDVELHDVMIAAQKATISLNATMEVRNKVVEAYQEIIRMPV